MAMTAPYYPWNTFQPYLPMEIRHLSTAEEDSSLVSAFRTGAAVATRMGLILGLT